MLSELDANISKAEIRLSEIKLRERRTGVMLILYSTIVWAAFLLYGFFTLHNHDDIDTETKLLTLAPVFLIPFG